MVTASRDLSLRVLTWGSDAERGLNTLESRYHLLGGSHTMSRSLRMLSRPGPLCPDCKTVYSFFILPLFSPPQWVHSRRLRLLQHCGSGRGQRWEGRPESIFIYMLRRPRKRRSEPVCTRGGGGPDWEGFFFFFIVNC